MEQLSKYVNSGFVFHGSNVGNITAFQPRQAYSFDVPDGEPGVYASSEIGPAIFMAIIGSRKTGGMGKNNGSKFGFFVSKSDIDKARAENWNGFIYVLPMRDFIQRNDWEWKAAKTVIPEYVCAVAFSDLPKHIEIMQDEDFFSYISACQL